MGVDLADIAARLQARMAELAVEEDAAAASTAPVTLEQDAVGRLSRIDAMQMQAMALATQERRRMEKERILAALRRIECGDYGWCVACGEDIAPARLRSDPTATHCIGCAR
jgi:DnaK suppressor protein